MSFLFTCDCYEIGAAQVYNILWSDPLMHRFLGSPIYASAGSAGLCWWAYHRTYELGTSLMTVNWGQRIAEILWKALVCKPQLCAGDITSEYFGIVFFLVCLKSFELSHPAICRCMIVAFLVFAAEFQLEAFRSHDLSRLVHVWHQFDPFDPFDPRQVLVTSTGKWWRTLAVKLPCRFLI